MLYSFLVKLTLKTDKKVINNEIAIHYGTEINLTWHVHLCAYRCPFMLL